MGALDEPLITRHRLNVDQYHRMAETGVLAPNARVELIEGELIDMAPTGTRHWTAVSRLNLLLVEALRRRALVAVQQSLRIDRHNEPQPDIAVLRWRDDFYRHELPSGPDALLVMEVSDTTLAFDLSTKARLYATHGVPEYWVIDLPASALHMHRGFDGVLYGEVVTLRVPTAVSLPGLDDTGIDLREIFQ